MAEEHEIAREQGPGSLVEHGEIVGFLGPNGAGKTTTMRMIAGYTAATSGRVLVAPGDWVNPICTVTPASDLRAR